MGVGGYGKCPLQPFMTFKYWRLYQEFIWKHFGDLSLYSKLGNRIWQSWYFFIATVFGSHGFPSLILFLVLFSKQNTSFMQVCLHCLDFVACGWSWSVLSHFWWFSDIIGKSRNPTLRKNLRIEGIRTSVWISERNYQVIWCHCLHF